MKKKLFSVVLALCMVVALLPAVQITAEADSEIWDGISANPLGGGDGSNASEAYEITTAEQLAYLAQQVNGGYNYHGKYIKLTDNIVLNDTSGLDSWDTSAPANEWTPIGEYVHGTKDTHFSGTFDGDGHTVSGIYINDATANYCGFFGYVKGGTIKNVGVEKSYIKDDGAYTVGGVCGQIEGSSSITNCYNTGSVEGSSSNVGGVCGVLDTSSSITNCYNTGNVSGTQDVGGVCGATVSSNTVTNCYNTGSVSGTQDVGGVCGLLDTSSSITNCCNTGSVSGTEEYVGGVCARMEESSSITNCYNTGSVSGTADVGGVCGKNDSSSTVTNCYNTGNVSGTEYCVGGVCGDNTDSSTVTNCYNTGSVSGTANVGGVCGYNGDISTLTNCYNTGSVEGSSSNVGGVCGENDSSSTVTNCYYDNARCIVDGINGADVLGQAEGETKSVMTSGSIWAVDGDAFYGFWDCTWMFAEGLYPRLRTLTQSYAENAPTLESKTDTTITVVMVAGHEYSKNNGATWQKSNVFEELTANNAYSIVMRINKIATTMPSATSAALLVTTKDSAPVVHSVSRVHSVPKKDIEYAEITNSKGETIKGTVDDTENGFEITIKGDDFNGGNSGGIKIVARSVEVTFNKTAASYIGSTAGSDNIVLTIGEADVLEMSPKAQKLIGNRPVYDITLMTGDTQISDFCGTATVTVPYKIASWEDPNAVVVYYMDDEGNLTTVLGKYDVKTGTVKFTLTHFSQYAVGYNKVSFDDVLEEAWYYDAVTFCAAREITTGTGNNVFSPNGTLTRGQFIVMLMRAYGIDADKDTADNFDDAGDTYYTGYLASAKILGITNGVGDNMFLPNNKITRQDMFTLLYRALDVLDELPDNGTGVSLSDFSDTDKIADYAESAMETFVKSDIISGSDGKLDPLGSSTRAQMAQVLYNLLW